MDERYGPSSNVPVKIGKAGQFCLQQLYMFLPSASPFSLPARPPRQLEFTEFWAWERERGHGLTIQPLIPFQQAWPAKQRPIPNRVLGRIAGEEHHEFDAKKDGTYGMSGAAAPKSGVRRHKMVMRYQ